MKTANFVSSSSHIFPQSMPVTLCVLSENFLSDREGVWACWASLLAEFIIWNMHALSHKYHHKFQPQQQEHCTIHIIQEKKMNSMENICLPLHSGSFWQYSENTHTCTHYIWHLLLSQKKSLVPLHCSYSPFGYSTTCLPPTLILKKCCYNDNFFSRLRPFLRSFKLSCSERLRTMKLRSTELLRA